MNEAYLTNGIKAVAAAAVAILTLFSTQLKLAPGWTDPHFTGLIVTGLTSLVSAYYTGKHIATPVAPAPTP